MSSNIKVDNFIKKQEKWQAEMIAIRKVFNSTELTEDLKWGAPIYTFQNKNIVGMVGFKKHLGIWFHQGVFLKDPYNKLVLAEKSTAKALRHWKILEGETINYNVLKAYVLEAIENQKAGIELKPKKKEAVNSSYLNNELLKNSALSTAFKLLSPGKRNEYMEHILMAKQEATKLRRIKKIIPLILDGKGLNDKYKNC
ncbi:YdeI/OmpD-associated family protein [Patiriisocius marinus]|uniref:YdhG-like domain-containing protein n=1 Tax=Patiriisocius marinus TaxID=1397112 RepID=A0A5J4IZT1_9FLAO|nr:DUF1801 domain-containing protein [Patiriisocius marinus]GER59061.1 hypothetical protein ULMA_11690 [Patiriisocius marinus]